MKDRTGRAENKFMSLIIREEIRTRPKGLGCVKLSKDLKLLKIIENYKRYLKTNILYKYSTIDL